LLLAAVTNTVHGQIINLRMSVKVIVDPVTGALPDGVRPQTFTNAVAAANEWMASYWRGYRYQLTELVDIGGPSQGGTNGPSRWFGINFRFDPLRATFFGFATNDSRYLLRTDQINVYVATGLAGPGDSGGAMPIPPGETNFIGGQIFVDDGAWWIVHELGHFFGLLHTFNGEDEKTCTPGDDGLADTLPDSNCWTNSDMVSQYYFNVDYSGLSAGEREQIDNVYFNAMSYHEAVKKNTVENRRTELQLDRHADHASSDRNAFASGRTWFVDGTSSFPQPDGRSMSYSSSGSVPVGGPYLTVASGIASANPAGGDIVLLRPGTYREQLTITKRVTLRASRAGPATIGKF
jgi:hypothetical protein